MPNHDPNKKAPKSKDAFWHFARSMFRYYWLMAAAFVMVVLSSLTLTAGILGSSPILNNLIGDQEHRKDLPELAADFNQNMAGRTWQFLHQIQIPQRWIDQMPHGEFKALAIIMGALAVITVIGSIANFLHAYISLTIVNRTVTGIRRQAFFTTLRAPLRVIVQGGTSDTISRIVNDTTQLANGLTMLLSKALLQIFKGVAGLAAALWFNWAVTVAALLVAPALYYVIRKLGKKIKHAPSGKALQSQAGLYAAAAEKPPGHARRQGLHHRGLRGRPLPPHQQARHARAQPRPHRPRPGQPPHRNALDLPPLRPDARRRLGHHPRRLPRRQAHQGRAGRLHLHHHLPRRRRRASLKPLTGIINDIQASAPAADRLKELLAAKPEPGHGFKLPRLPRHKESIEFRTVSLTYPNASTPAINGVSLRVPHGKPRRLRRPQWLRQNLPPLPRPPPL